MCIRDRDGCAPDDSAFLAGVQIMYFERSGPEAGLARDSQVGHATSVRGPARAAFGNAFRADDQGLGAAVGVHDVEVPAATRCWSLQLPGAEYDAARGGRPVGHVLVALAGRHEGGRCLAGCLQQQVYGAGSSDRGPDEHDLVSVGAVSYTHLDVYKRQFLD